MSIMDWFFSPLVDITNTLRTPILSDEEFIKRINEKKSTLQTCTREKIPIFRPSNFDEYIGQTKAKEILKEYIKFKKERNIVFPHTLIHGFAGCGKTTLVRLLAKELELPFIETVAPMIKDNIDLEIKIEDCKGGILFIDEIHGLERSICESIYTAMEDFSIRGQSIKTFTLIGATTELGEMIKNRKPFLDRFKTPPIELEEYTNDEITTIVRQYKYHTFPYDDITDETFHKIGLNSRNTPRQAIRLLEASVYFHNNLDKVLYSFNIIKDGFTKKDLKSLEYIESNGNGVGLQGISSYLGISIDNYLYEIEPYLLKNNLIVRTGRGRKITKKGIEKIKELKN